MAENDKLPFVCQSCDADFEIEIPQLVESPAALKCPNCGKVPAPHRAHALSTALEDLLAAAAGVRSQVRFELTLDNHEMPEPYGSFEQQGGLEFDENGRAEDFNADDEEEEDAGDEDALLRSGFQEDEDEDEEEDDGDMNALVQDLGDDDDDDDDFDDLDDFDDDDDDEFEDDDFDDLDDEEEQAV